MKPKYYGKRKALNVVKRVPFAWRSWAIVGAIKTCRNGIAFYKRMVADKVFPHINHYFRTCMVQFEIQQGMLLSKFEEMLCNESKVGSMHIQQVGNGVYQLLKITRINSKLRTGGFVVVCVGTKDQCERARDMLYGN